MRAYQAIGEEKFEVIEVEEKIVDLFMEDEINVAHGIAAMATLICKMLQKNHYSKEQFMDYCSNTWDGNEKTQSE